MPMTIYDKASTDELVASRLSNPSAWGALIAAMPLRTTRLVKWVTCGSSTTYSATVTEADRYPAKVLAKLQAAYTHTTTPGVVRLADAAATAPTGTGIIVINAGVSGSRSGTQNGATPYLTATTRQQIAALNPDLISHMIGANDYGNGVPVATYKANLLAHLADFDARGVTAAHLFFHTYPRYDAAAQSAKVAEWPEYRKALMEIAAARGDVSVVDLAPDFSAIRIPGADRFSFMHTDLIHLVPAGQTFMADTIARKVGIPSGAAAATTPPPASLTRTLLTSDRFTGGAASQMQGRATDVGLGGTAKTWQEAVAGAWAIDADGRLVRGTATTGFVGLPITESADLDFEFTVPVLSNASGTVLFSADMRRTKLATGGNCIRLRMRTDGSFTLAQITGETVDTAGTEAALYTAAAGALPAGAAVRIRVLGTTASVFVNGTLIKSETVAVTAAGFLGFAKSSSITTGAIDELAVYTLAAA